MDPSCRRRAFILQLSSPVARSSRPSSSDPPVIAATGFSGGGIEISGLPGDAIEASGLSGDGIDTSGVSGDQIETRGASGGEHFVTEGVADGAAAGKASGFGPADNQSLEAIALSRKRRFIKQVWRNANT
jgi:hypothetical protein